MATTALEVLVQEREGREAAEPLALRPEGITRRICEDLASNETVVRKAKMPYVLLIRYTMLAGHVMTRGSLPFIQTPASGVSRHPKRNIVRQSDYGTSGQRDGCPSALENTSRNGVEGRECWRASA